MSRPADSLMITTPAEREVRVERTFDAPRDRVWRAWTEPELIAEWWGRGRKTIVERMEVKRGGHYRFVVDGVSGTEGFEGRYREVTPPERLVYTFEWDGMPGYVIIDTVEFEDLGDGRTRVITTAQFFSREERDGFVQSGAEAGFRDAYAALDRLLAGRFSASTRPRSTGRT
jgi:uncharacterized protein YndB with AHSA1/START domain